MSAPHVERQPRPFGPPRIGRSVVLIACIGVALVLGAAARSAAGPAPSFAAARNYEIGRLPFSVAIGDLNDDGKPDLVTASWLDPGGMSDGALSVLLNRGDGRFRAGRDYEVGVTPRVAIADVNGDRVPDSVTANQGDNTISILLNNGGGVFANRRDYATGDEPFDVALGDLNNDGDADVVTADVGSNTVSVLMNQGDGKLAARHGYRTARGPEAVAIGDLNRDGKADLVTANNDARTVSVLLNDGAGSFDGKRDYRTGRAPASVVIADLNGDAKPDVATANEFGTVSVLLGRGDGSLQTRRDYRTRGSDAIAVGDLNRDGRPDVLTSEGAAKKDLNAVSVLLNRGKGRLEGKIEYSSGGGAYPANTGVALGDLNGDGRLDIAVTNKTGPRSEFGYVAVLINRAGLCNVQDVVGLSIAAARQAFARAHCDIGRVRRISSKSVKKGRVISQKPKFGAVRRAGAKVDLVVSLGRKR